MLFQRNDIAVFKKVVPGDAMPALKCGATAYGVYFRDKSKSRSPAEDYFKDVYSFTLFGSTLTGRLLSKCRRIELASTANLRERFIAPIGRCSG